ncbi:hypothetical protein [Victivallis vadensis]|uniref:hypothetical protein n=1 Tax=Victivallis vadensis TaxID=172901 RepID=UPI0026DB2BAE|nr:hypothetical protein [Victivallis vadensis]
MPESDFPDSFATGTIVVSFTLTSTDKSGIVVKSAANFPHLIFVWVGVFLFHVEDMPEKGRFQLVPHRRHRQTPNRATQEKTAIMNMVISDLRLCPVWKDLAIFLLSMPHGSHCELPVYLIVFSMILLPRNLHSLRFIWNIVPDSFKVKYILMIVVICPLPCRDADIAD